MEPITRAFVAAILRFADEQGVDLVRFEKGQPLRPPNSVGGLPLDRAKEEAHPAVPVPVGRHGEQSRIVLLSARLGQLAGLGVHGEVKFSPEFQAAASRAAVVN